LRPGFHSGALPKAFAALRRASRKAEQTGDWKPVHRKWTAVQHVEVAVRRFVERELLGLLDEVNFLPGKLLTVGEIHAATHRIDVELDRSDKPGQAAVLRWEDDGRKLIGAVTCLGWLDSLPPHERETLHLALTGLFQRAGVDEVRGPLEISCSPPVAWDDWAARWTEVAKPTEAVQAAPNLTRAG
jgi:hypothetical protein